MYKSSFGQNAPQVQQWQIGLNYFEGTEAGWPTQNAYSVANELFSSDEFDEGAMNTAYYADGTKAFSVINGLVYYNNGTAYESGFYLDEDFSYSDSWKPGANLLLYNLGSNDKCNFWVVIYNVFTGTIGFQSHELRYCIILTDKTQDPQYRVRRIKIFDPNGGNEKNNEVFTFTGIGTDGSNPIGFCVAPFNPNYIEVGGTNVQIGRAIFTNTNSVVSMFTIEPKDIVYGSSSSDDVIGLQAKAVKITSSIGNSNYQALGTGAEVWKPFDNNNNSADNTVSEMEVKIIRDNCGKPTGYRIANVILARTTTPTVNYKVEHKMAVVEIDYINPLSSNYNYFKMFEFSDGNDLYNTATVTVYHKFSGLEFSPDGKYLYAVQKTVNNSNNYFLYVDLTNTTTDNFSVLNLNNNAIVQEDWRYSHIEIGPDDNFYLINNSSSNNVLRLSNLNTPSSISSTLFTLEDHPMNYFRYYQPQFDSHDEFTVMPLVTKIDEEDYYVPSGYKPEITIISSTNTCTGTISFTISNFIKYYSYVWTISGGAITSNDGCGNITVTRNSDCGSSFDAFTIMVKVVGSCEDNSSTILDIPACCTPSGVNQNKFIRIADGYVFTTSKTYGGKDFIIEGTCKINPGVTINMSSCNVFMGKEASITNEGNFLLIGSTVKAACCYMWDQIFLNSGSNFTATKSTFMDAINGVVATGNANFKLNTCTFNKNYYAVRLTDFSNNVQNYTIAKCIFTGENVTTGDPELLLLSPLVGWNVNIGVYSQNSTAVIGVDNKQQPNKFKYVSFGVYSENSNLSIINNQFSDLLFYGYKGEGIRAVGHDFKTVVGTGINSGNKFTGNSFNNCKYGIKCESAIELTVKDNSFTNNTFGMDVKYCNDAKIFVDGNTLDDNRYAMAFSDNINVLNADGTPNPVTPIFTISNNNINLNATNNEITESIGISVTNTAKTKISENLLISHNTIYKVERGIFCSQLNSTVIKDNSVYNLSKIGNNANTSGGIIVWDSEYPTISSNWVDAGFTTAEAKNYWREANIRVDNSTAPTLNCNYTSNGFIGLYAGGGCSGARIMANKMQNDFYGFNLNWCYTDLQLGVFDAGNPSGQPIGNKGGNTWAGSFNAHTFSYNSHGIANGWLMPQTTTTTGNANTPVESEYPLNMVNGVFNSPGVPMVFPLKPYDQINYPTADAGCNTAQSIQNSNGNTNFNKERAREVAIGVPHFIGLSDGGIWNEKVKLHQSIVHNPTIISGDVILTNFADEFAGSVTAELIRISRESILAKKDAVKKADLKAELQNLILIEEKDIKLAKTVEANLILESASNNLESLSYKSLNDSAATQTIDTLVLLAELREIAALCPYEYGLAVYSARAILFNWDQSIYNNICEDGYIANDSVSTSKIAAPTGFNKEANNNFSFANNGIKIYPNPAKEQVSLWINEKQNLEIIDMLGKLVYYAELEGGVSEIEIKEFSEGIYLLKLENFNKEITYGKLVIKR